MAIVLLYEHRRFKNFPKTETAVFSNIPIQIGIGKITNPKQKFEPYIPDWFKELEQKLLHPELNTEVLKLHNKTLGEIWEQKRDPVFWSRINGDKTYYNYTDEDGDDCSESYDHFIERPAVHKRNNTIFKIRCKYLSDTKKGKYSYEKLGYYTYKNDQAKAQFLEEVEQKGLTRYAEPKKSTVGITSMAYSREYMSNRYQEDEL